MKSFAIIGCGNIAKKHAAILGGNFLKDAFLAAVCDFDKEKLEKLSSEYSVPGYSNYIEMANAVKIDFFVILTPSGTHSKIIFDLAPFKKNFIVEKPLSLALEDIAKVKSLSNQHGCKIFVLMQNRFNQPIAALKDLLENQQFGHISIATARMRWSRNEEYYKSAPWRGTWQNDGGVLTNQGIHFIDLLLWLVGDVQSVFAYSIKALANIEAEDTMVAVLKFKNGAIGTIEFTTASRPKDLEGSISIIGSKGSIEIAGFSANLLKKQEMVDSGNLIPESKHQNPKTEYPFAHQQFYNAVMQKLTNEHFSLHDCDEAKNCMEVIHAMYESIETNKEVIIGGMYNNSKLGKPQ